MKTLKIETPTANIKVNTPKELKNFLLLFNIPIENAEKLLKGEVVNYKGQLISLLEGG